MHRFLIKRVIISAVMFLGVMMPSKALVPISKNAKKIKFAGRTWAVKEFERFTVKPGPNYFRKENVWVDKNGYLHLKIYKDVKTGRIYCSEVYSEDIFSYGNFEVEMDSLDYNKFPINAVLGIFTYRGSGEEIDLEFTYMFWTNNFVNYSVQPMPPIYKFTPDLSGNTRHIIKWQKNRVEFKSICAGKTYHKKFDALELSAKSAKSKSAYEVIPDKPSRFHINLWFHKESPPPLKYTSKKYKNSRTLEEFEVVIKDFKYTPSKKPPEPKSMTARHSR